MWYYAQQGQTFGPVTLEKLKELARAGTLKATDHVLPVGSQEWRVASGVEELFPREAPPMPAIQATPPAGGGGPPPMQAAPPAFRGGPPPMDDAEPRGTWSIPSAFGDGPPAFYGPEEPTLGQKIGRHFKRLFTWNLQRVDVDEDEKRFLRTQGVEEATLQRYLVWRHSILLVLVFPVFLLAVLNTIDRLTAGDLSGINALGKAVLVFVILLPFALPFSAVLALIVWYRGKLSWRLLLLGWVIATAGPLFVYVIPVHAQIDTSRMEGMAPQEREQVMTLVRLVVGFLAFTGMMIQLPVFAVTAAYGTQRACLRLKTLLPQSSVPGLFLAVTAPVFSLILLPFFVLFSQIASNPLLFLGMICLICAPLVYTIYFKRMVSPFLEGRDFTRLRVLQIIATVIFWVGVLFLVIYALAVPVPFVDAEKVKNLKVRPGANPMQVVSQVTSEKPIIGVSSEHSWIRPWDWKLIRWVVVELLGRSLFTMILVADLFMRVNSYVWLSSRRVMGSDHADSYDNLMERLHTSGKWDRQTI